MTFVPDLNLRVGNQLVSIEEFIKPYFPDCLYIKQTIPEDPKPLTFAVRLLTSSNELDTRNVLMQNKDFQIVYFGTDIQDTIDRIDILNTVLVDGVLIPIIGTDHNLTVEEFFYSQPVRMENHVDSVVAVLRTCMRQRLERPSVPVIEKVVFDINPNEEA